MRLLSAWFVWPARKDPPPEDSLLPYHPALATPAQIERHAEESSKKPPNNLCARQCPDELAHRLSLLLVPDLGNVADDIEQHTLV